MFKTTVLVLITLCGLQTPSPAQVHFGIHVGGRVTAHARIGPVSLHVGSSHRVHHAPRLTRPRYAHRSHRVHDRRLGHDRWVTRKVWVPGSFRVVWVRAQFGTRYDACGNPVRVMIRPAHSRKVWREGYWKRERTRVWTRH